MLRKNDGKIVIIIVAVVLIIAVVAGLAIMRKPGHGKKHKVPDGPVSLLTVGELVVNLADKQDIRYLKIDAVLEICGKMEAGGEGEGGGESAQAPLRDAIITVLSSKTMTSLSQPDGKEALKKEMIEACNKRLKEARVKNVYFNEFAMQ